MSNDTRTQNMIDLINSNEDFIQQFSDLAKSVAVESGDPSFARFIQAITFVSRDHIKPVFGDVKSAMKPEKVSKSKGPRTPVDNTWRAEQKALFTGRGMQWIYVPIDSVSHLLEEDNEVQEFFEAAGQAWVRYAGPRIEDNTQMAAFEVRTLGSKVPTPKNLIYIPHEEIMSGEFNRLEEGKTPAQLKLEEVSQPEEDEGAPINLSEDSDPDVEIDETLLVNDEETEINEDLF